MIYSIQNGQLKSSKNMEGRESTQKIMEERGLLCNELGAHKKVKNASDTDVSVEAVHCMVHMHGNIHILKS